MTKIKAYCCENSALKAAGPLAGSPLLESVELVAVPCAGSVEVAQMLKDLEAGVDRVLVLGCPIDNCKYLKGNCRALKRVEAVRKTLKSAGLDENAVAMAFVSSVDTHKLKDILKRKP